MIAELPINLPPIATPLPRVSIDRQARPAPVKPSANKGSQADGPTQQPPSPSGLEPSQVPTPFSAGKPGLAPRGEQRAQQSLSPGFAQHLLHPLDLNQAYSQPIRAAAPSTGTASSHAAGTPPSGADLAGPSGISTEDRQHLQSEGKHQSPFAQEMGLSIIQADQSGPAIGAEGQSPLAPNPKRDAAERRKKLQRAGSSSCWASTESGPIDQAWILLLHTSLPPLTSLLSALSPLQMCRQGIMTQ